MPANSARRGVTRRQVVAGGGAAAFGVLAPRRWAEAASNKAAGKTAPITLVINQSPWFDSFRRVVELYEKETGNRVELDVNPFAGSNESDLSPGTSRLPAGTVSAGARARSGPVASGFE